MKYKLINRKTREETLCDKITIDEFDYYVSDEKRLIDDFYIGIGFMRDNVFKWHHSQEKEYPNQKGKVIATTNPSLDIPKVVNEVEKFENEYFKSTSWGNVNPRGHYEALRAGYNKSQETHPFSEEDMIEFAKYHKTITCNCKGEIPHPDKNSRPDDSLEVNLQLWKDQRIKTLYYE